jgi:hypothetical protein
VVLEDDFVSREPTVPLDEASLNHTLGLDYNLVSSESMVSLDDSPLNHEVVLDEPSLLYEMAIADHDKNNEYTYDSMYI